MRGVSGLMPAVARVNFPSAGGRRGVEGGVTVSLCRGRNDEATRAVSAVVRIKYPYLLIMLYGY